MKLTYHISALATAAVAAFSLSSCSDSFLDREPGGAWITDTQLQETMKWNTQVLLGEMQGVSKTLIVWKSGGTTRQDDFGQKSVDIATDLMSHDMVFSRGNSYGWFEDEAQNLNTTYTADRDYILWRYYYNVINACNLILDTAGGDTKEPESATNKFYYAVAKTVRAQSYYNLLINYADNYKDAKDKKVLPVYRTQSTAYAAPQTVDSVYNLVIADLKGAITAYENATAGGYENADISLPGIDVAYTQLAYAYLQKGDDANAKVAAEAAIKNSTKKMLSGDDLFFGFNTVNNNDWMWGIDITADNTGGLCTFWGMMDYFTYSYTAAGDFKAISSDLFNEIPATDERRTWFTAFGDKNPANLIPANKFFDAGRKAMGDRLWQNDIHFMRIEEPYLIAAEAAARTNDLATARQYLAALLEGRDAEAAAKVETMSQQQLLDAIYFNWRLEFWGEGKSLQTKKRFEKDIVPPANDYFKSVGTLKYNSESLRFAIPQKELQNNPLMKDAQQ